MFACFRAPGQWPQPLNPGDSRPQKADGRDTRSLSIDPVQTSEASLVGTTSYGMLHLVGSFHSLMVEVFGSNSPIALPPYSANHRRFCSSTRPRRGRVP